MTIRSQFFDSVNGDRVYDAFEFSQHLLNINFDGIIQNNDTDGLKVIENTVPDKQVRIELGSAFIRGHFFEVFNSEELLTIPDNNTGALRTDLIVIRLDNTNRQAILAVKEGTTLLQRDSLIWELMLARVQTLDGFTTVTQADIFDERTDLFLCGKSKPTTLRQGFQNTLGSTGWFRISVNNGLFRTSETGRNNEGYARFVVRVNEGVSIFGNLTFEVSTNNGEPQITLLHRSGATTGVFTGIRLVFNANGDCAIELNVNSIGTYTFEIYDNYSDIGWFPINWTAGATLTSIVELDFTTIDAVWGFANVTTTPNAFLIDRTGKCFAKGAYQVSTNNVEVTGIETGGTERNLAKVNNFNSVELGDTGRPTFINSNTDPAFNTGANQFTLFHAGFIQPNVRVFNSANQSIANNTVTAVTYNSERWDTDTMADLGVNNTRITIQTDGYYLVTFSGRWATQAGGTRLFSIRLNGVTLIGTTQLESVGGSTNVRQEVSTTYSFTAGDFIEVVAFQTSGVAVNLETAGNVSPEFMASFLSPN